MRGRDYDGKTERTTRDRAVLCPVWFSALQRVGKALRKETGGVKGLVQRVAGGSYLQQHGAGADELVIAVVQHRNGPHEGRIVGAEVLLNGYGQLQILLPEKTLLFLPCTAEPEWAFADSVGLLSQDYHVIQIVYDGHGETGEDFISVETTVDEVTDWLQARGITHLNAAYGCSLGGACLTRFLALGKIPVERAVIDAGITPYRMSLILRRLACLRDNLGFRLIAKSRKVLETVYPPERWTMPGRDPVKEYDALAAYLKTYSKRTVRNIFWSANNYTLPTKPAEMGCQITYWYGEEEKQARHSNICFIKQYFPRAQLHEIPKMDHAELVMMYPQDFYRRIMEFLTHTSAAQNKRS